VRSLVRCLTSLRLAGGLGLFEEQVETFAHVNRGRLPFSASGGFRGVEGLEQARGGAASPAGLDRSCASPVALFGGAARALVA